MRRVREGTVGWGRGRTWGSRRAVTVSWPTIASRTGPRVFRLAILGVMPRPRSPLSRLFTVLLAGLLAGLALAVAALPGNLLADLPSVEVVEHLGRPAPGAAEG